MKMTLNFAGPLSTVVDGGRHGYMSVGFSAGGAMDLYAMRIANILVGNEMDEGALEMTFMGIDATFDSDAVIAITGADMAPMVDGEPIPLYKAVTVRGGQTLSMKMARCGMRSYLAVAGGFDIEKVMGSYSTNLKCAIGGFEGRKLKAGDEIFLRRGSRVIKDRFVDCKPQSVDSVTVRVVLGPQDDYFTDKGISDFFTKEYTVSDKSDRMGVRLSGTAIENKNGVDIISDAVAMGSIQIPASGEPIIMMADRQTTGGYAKIATVITADLRLIAQAAPGTKVHFKKVSESKAVRLLKKQQKKLFRLNRQLNFTK
ncbi:MAG: biotin-dependent carboxyltransferase [Clostridia bacterium]|nr:biotin-dependent carboxyltransferase [Clostridia bacterium]